MLHVNRLSCFSTKKYFTFLIQKIFSLLIQEGQGIAECYNDWAKRSTTGRNLLESPRRTEIFLFSKMFRSTPRKQELPSLGIKWRQLKAVHPRLEPSLRRSKGTLLFLYTHLWRVQGQICLFLMHHIGQNFSNVDSPDSETCSFFTCQQQCCISVLQNSIEKYFLLSRD